MNELLPGVPTTYKYYYYQLAITTLLGGISRLLAHFYAVLNYSQDTSVVLENELTAINICASENFAYLGSLAK